MIVRSRFECRARKGRLQGSRQEHEGTDADPCDCQRNPSRHLSYREAGPRRSQCRRAVADGGDGPDDREENAGFSAAFRKKTERVSIVRRGIVGLAVGVGVRRQSKREPATNRPRLRSS